MTPGRRHPRAAIAAALVLPMLAPGALALALDDPTATTPSSTPERPPVLIAEQPGTAREVIPFGSTRPAGQEKRTFWAFGRTRPASSYDGTTPVAPQPSTPTNAVLLQGTATTDQSPTAWRRADAPLDAAGQPLPGGAWRPADGTTALPTAPPTTPSGLLHAGAATPAGAAGLLVRIAIGGGAQPRNTVLARTTDGHFRELPAPPAELVAPATAAFAGPGDATVPMAVVDAPTDADHADRGRTAVLLAPAGGDGVLRWDGARWTEEPWEDGAGTPAGARTALALAATPAGDAVALFAGDPTGPSAARVELARRDGAAHAYRPVAVDGSRLLAGDLPSNVSAIRPVAAPGQPLTISPKHWWIDVVVTRDDKGVPVPVSATVHLRPPALPVVPPTTGDATTPTSTTTPAGTSTSPTTPAGTSTTPATTPAGPATATDTWCTPTLSTGAGCTHDLGFQLATERGYTSAAFDDGSAALGQRAISSPVIPETEGATTAKEASASGGFLELDGQEFALRSGLGDDGTDFTPAAAFAPNGFALIGGRRAVGKTMPGTSPDTALESYDAGVFDQYIDVAVSPPGTPDELKGALEMDAAQQFRRQIGKVPWRWASSSTGGMQDRGPQPVTAFAWPKPDLILVAGGDLLYEAPAPAANENYLTDQVTQPPTIIDAAKDLDLLDVAGQGEDAWAVGRHGAALHRTTSGWKRVALPDPFATADLLSVAYAGRQAIVTSSVGVFTATPTGELVLDADLAALLRADGRPAAAQVVAGTPDGAAVVDGRYVRTAPLAPWQRLASPVEGDVTALALWRDGPSATPADTTTPTSTTATTPVPPLADLGDLRIAAAIADVARPIEGATTEVPTGPKGETTKVPGALVPKEGRVAVLAPDGWVDRDRRPTAPSVSRDLAEWSPPITAMAVDPTGNGWAVGGSGSFLSYGSSTEPSSSISFDAPLGTPPFDLTPPDLVAAAPQPVAVQRSTGRRRQGALVSRLLIGGHPACLDECAGRGDQHLGPDANVEDAVSTALGLRAQQPGLPPVLIIGGGRGGKDHPLSAAGARRYAEILDEQPDLPIAVAIGTGDVGTDESRHAFAAEFGGGVRHATANIEPVTIPTTPESFARTDTVAYAFDVSAEGDAGANGPRTRVVVIDNAGGTLRGGIGGAQTEWIRQALDTPYPVVVVGASRLDAAGTHADDRDFELELLHRASAYVATDGPDDPTSPTFMPRTASVGVDTSFGGHLELYRASGLGHLLPDSINNGRFLETPTEDPKRDPDLDTGYGGVGLLQLDVPPVSGARTDASVVPVLQHMLAAPPYYAVRGSADVVPAYATGRGGTGLKVKRSAFPDMSGPQFGGPPPSTPGGTTPGPTTPGGTSPDPNELLEARSTPLLYLLSLPCRVFGTSSNCAGQLPIDTQFETDDPSVAVFVRADPPKRGNNQPPVIPTDEHGDPIPDHSSSVLCPLRAGRTMMTVTASGRRARYELVVDEPHSGQRAATTKAPCEFRWGPVRKADEPAPAPSTPPLVPGGLVPAPIAPKLVPHPAPIHHAVPLPIPPAVALLPAVGFLPVPMSGGSVSPPVTANPKPIVPSAPPAPPSGVSTQQVPVQQAATVQQMVTQEGRRTEVAREGVDHHATALSHARPAARALEPATPARADAPRGFGGASGPTIYRTPPPASTTAPLLAAGGLLALFAAAAGRAAGIRRRRARAASRRWLR